MQHTDTQHKIFLYPGGFHFATDAGMHIHTILGSCISISLWHPQLHIGGMCHFVLPERSESESAILDGRYGDDAMELFRCAVSNCGTQLHEYQGKIFGGSNIFGLMSGSGEDLIGTRNAQKALELLIMNNIETLVVHVGESGYRRIVFDVDSGDVWVKHSFAERAPLKNFTHHY